MFREKCNVKEFRNMLQNQVLRTLNDNLQQLATGAF